MYVVQVDPFFSAIWRIDELIRNNLGVKFVHLCLKPVSCFVHKSEVTNLSQKNIKERCCATAKKSPLVKCGRKTHRFLPIAAREKKRIPSTLEACLVDFFQVEFPLADICVDYCSLSHRLLATHASLFCGLTRLAPWNRETDD